MSFFVRSFYLGLAISGYMIAGLTSPAAHADVCEDLFRPTVTRKSSGLRGLGRSLVESVVPSLAKSRAVLAFEQSFVQSERDALHAVLVPGSRGTDVRRLESGTRAWESRDPIFLYLYFERMSVTARSILTRIMSSGFLNPKDRVGSAYELIAHIGEAPVRTESFVSVLLESWTVNTRNNSQSYSEWSAALRETYLLRKAEGVFETREFQVRLNEAVAYTLAYQMWRRKVPLQDFGSTTNRDGNLVIGERRFGKVESESADEVVIRVPREMIKRAAWNPISNREILNKIQNGFQKVRVYEGFLGADGYFYLSDGNHRFALDSRHEVLLRLSRPMTVSSLSDTLDALGVPQPKFERIIQFHQGSLSLAELIGETAANQLMIVPAR